METENLKINVTMVPTTVTGGCSEIQEYSDGYLYQWDDNTYYYDGEDYLACQQNDWDEEELRADIELCRMEQKYDEAFRWNIARLLLVAGVVIIGLSLGQLVVGWLG